MDSDDEEEVPDFPQNSPGSNDSQAEIQILIDDLQLGSCEGCDEDKADKNEAIISLQDLKGPVILDVSPASATQDMFLKMEKLTFGMETYPFKPYSDLYS